MTIANKKSALITSVLSILFAATVANAAPAKMEVTKEKREKMAVMHDKMAACLRSEKTMEDCHMEMKKSCEADKDCHAMMMGKMHGKFGKRSADKDTTTEEQ